MSVYWFLCGNEANPSSRIHGIRVHEKLRALGYSSQVVHKPHRYVHDLYFHDWVLFLMSFCFGRGDTVVFQKVHGKRTQKLMDRLKSKGVRLIFIDCDLPIKPETASRVHVIVCVSNELCKHYQVAGLINTVCIDDAVELYLPPSFVKNAKKKIVWFGKSGQGKWNSVAWVKKEIVPHIEREWEFVTISDHKDATHPWEVTGAPVHINQSDLVIIPVPDKEADQVKSANRCTQSLALGVPVLCNYLPAYREVIQDNENGLVSNDTAEWIKFIRKLDDEGYQKRLKENAFASAQEFSMDVIIGKWISALQLQEKKQTFSFLLSIASSSYRAYYALKRKLYLVKKSIKTM